MSDDNRNRVSIQVLAIYAILGLVTAIVLAGMIVLYLRLNSQQPLEILFITPTPYASTIVKVYLTGAIAREGVYSLQEGDRLEDALKAAGGPAAEADLETVNLALRLTDEGHYHFPKKGEPRAISGTAPATSPSLTPAKININTATQKELEALPGIGSVKAKAIVDYREGNGPFQRSEDILKVKGIGSAIYQQIKDLITTNP